MPSRSRGVPGPRWGLSSGSPKARPGGGGRRTELKRAASPLRLLLHVLDAGEDDAFGTFLGVAEIEFVLGQEHRIAVDVVGDAGAIGGDEGLELLAVCAGDP